MDFLLQQTYGIHVGGFREAIWRRIFCWICLSNGSVEGGQLEDWVGWGHVIS